MKEIGNSSASLSKELSQIIAQSRQKIALHINMSITQLYWRIGRHIHNYFLTDGRAGYGKRILQTVSAKLTHEHGKGFSERNLANMVKFYQYYPDENILSTLAAKLSWSHFLQLLSVDDSLKREFYAAMCNNEGWSVRELAGRIDSMLFERTAISKKPEKTIYNDLKLLQKEQKLSPDLVFKDPYFLDFLGLKDTYSEKDLESTILAQLQSFILEFGNDFAFLSRQKRITIDNDDFYIDLLFFHRKLKRLVAIELKLGKFKHEYKSQLELYLRWLDKHEKQEGENTPLGILLCAEKGDEMIELLELGKSGIHVASYLTELPPMEWLKEKLLQSIEQSKNRLPNQ